MPRVLLNGEALGVDEGTLLELVRGRGYKAIARGCEGNGCGACRVLVDGEALDSCTLRASTLREGAVIETYEAISSGVDARAVVEAFERERPTRCRLCTAGLGVTAIALSRARAGGVPTSVDEVVGEAACMCTGRGSWRRALSVL